jgi:hypothetical protein
MKPTIVTLIILILVPGCTSTKLKTSTVSQAGTLTELQYQQVLNNLAMFCTNPELLPSLVNLNDGSAQIADLGSASYLGDWHRAFASHPTILGSRTVVEQWGMSPVDDDTELDLLRIAFRRAVGIDESLQDHKELANDIAHELIKQLPEVDDYRGSIVGQFEDFKNTERSKLLNSQENAPENFLDVKAILSTIYAIPSGEGDKFSLTRNFARYTISSVDEKIIYDNELIKYIHIYAYYMHIACYKHREYHII